MKQVRGFAAMTPEKRKAIARRGGISVDASKRTFKTDPALARLAGKKGGARAAELRAAKARKEPTDD